MSRESSDSGDMKGDDHHPAVRTNDKALLLIYINVALYATCFQIQRPLEPFLVEKIGLAGSDSSGEYARLQSFFQTMQTLGSLVTGILLDKFGVKGGFIVSFIASALSYLLLSQATNLRLLYASKIPTVFQAGFLCAQLAASQMTSDGEDRVRALGRLTMSYTVGSVLGPAIGGFFGASGDYYLGARLAVVGSLLSVGITLLMPAVRVQGQMTKKNSGSKDNTITHTFSLSGAFVSMLSAVAVLRVVWLLLSTKVITSVANSMSQSAFPLILKDIYHLDEQSLGLSMSAMSAFNGVVNGFLLGPIVAFMGGKLTNVIGVSLALMTAVSFGIAIASLPQVIALSPLPGEGIVEFLGLTFILSVFQFLLSTSLTGQSTATVRDHEKGTLLGWEHSLFAAARIAAPHIGISLLKSGGVYSVSLACAGVFFVVLLVWSTFQRHVKGGANHSGNGSGNSSGNLGDCLSAEKSTGPASASGASEASVERKEK
jgi:MFS family permease